MRSRSQLTCFSSVACTVAESLTSTATMPWSEPEMMKSTSCSPGCVRKCLTSAAAAWAWTRRLRATRLSNSAALEDQVLEHALLVQMGEQEILRNVDKGGVTTLRSLRGVAGQPASSNAAHVWLASSRGSKGSRPSATLKRLSKRRLTRGLPNQVTWAGVVGCNRSATFGAMPLSR
jgi:hypothetical protein